MRDRKNKRQEMSKVFARPRCPRNRGKQREKEKSRQGQTMMIGRCRDKERKEGAKKHKIVARNLPTLEIAKRTWCPGKIKEEHGDDRGRTETHRGWKNQEHGKVHQGRADVHQCSGTGTSTRRWTAQ